MVLKKYHNTFNPGQSFKWTITTDVLEENKIKSSCGTQFNSKVKMIRSNLQILDNNLNSLDVPIDRNALKEMIEFYERFEDGTNCVQWESCFIKLN